MYKNNVVEEDRMSPIILTIKDFKIYHATRR